jgi:hypothetical protein
LNFGLFARPSIHSPGVWLKIDRGWLNQRRAANKAAEKPTFSGQEKIFPAARRILTRAKI